ncbi:MAG: hypothetical protein HY820_04070 [Acidobacteria bacterium]|nr:hypothetical protein [Acidobacteriota bacterium]
MSSINRRDLFQILAGALAARAAHAGLQGQDRRYRCDAVILLFSMSIYSRKGVGSGYACLRKDRRESGLHTRMAFAGGSWPERAKGLNHFGFIEENIQEPASSGRNGHYFGFMTSAKEESIDDAKQRLAKEGTGPVSMAAILGQFVAGRYECAVANLGMPAKTSWANWRPFLPQIRKSVEGTPGKASAAFAQGEIARPFLHVLMSAVHSKETKLTRSFGYSGRKYVLEMQKAADSKTGARLLQNGAVRSAADVIVASATIREASQKKQTKFRVWFDTAAGNPLPLRIELQPRSFLRLMFEADTTLTAFDWPSDSSTHEAIKTSV